jgi:SET domain-containing protein
MQIIDNDTFLNGFANLEEVIHHLKNNIKTKIAPSPIHGIGIFAIRDIKTGENIFPNWEFETGIYVIPNNRLNEIPNFVYELIDMYFINDECGYKVIRLFKGQNFICHGLSFCNSAYPSIEKVNMNISGIATKDIKAGEEILEWYTENINLEN